MYIHTYIHTHTHVHIHMLIHTHVNAHTCTNTATRSLFFSHQCFMFFLCDNQRYMAEQETYSSLKTHFMANV